MIYIPININRDTEIQNKELFNIIIDQYKVKIQQFDEQNQEYTFSNSYERQYRNNNKFKCKHYTYRNIANTLYRYDFMEFNDIQNKSLLMSIIEDYFPILQKFIDYNELTTIKFKIVNKINYSNYSNNASQLVNINIIDYPINTLPEILMIIALIRMMNFDDINRELLIFYQDLNKFINVINTYDINVYSIIELIKNNCQSNHIYDNAKFSLFGNNIISGSPINNKQNLFEFDFLNIITDLIQKNARYPEKIKDFFKKKELN